MKYGYQEDGSLLLCPESTRALQRVIRNSGRGGIIFPDNDDIKELLENFMKVCWEKQELGWEVYT